MNTHVSCFPLVSGITAIRINAGFAARAVTLISMNQPFITVEHDPARPFEVWQVLAIPSGNPFPADGQYLGTFPMAAQKQSYIKVAGSPGMTDQPEIEVTVCCAYIRPCPLEEIPEQFVEAAA